MKMDKFSELKAAALAATPGPWISGDDSWSDGDNANITTEERNDMGIIDIAQVNGGGSESDLDGSFRTEQQANAHYIAEANPAAVLELMAELESAQQRIAELERERDTNEAAALAMRDEMRAQEERAENAEQRIAGMEQALELEREKSRRVMSENHQQAKHIARLEHAEQRLCTANVSLDARAELAERENAELEQRLALVREQRDNELRTNAELEKRLAMPVRLPQRCRCEGYHIDEAYLVEDDEGDCFDRDEVIEILREQGFKVEGDA